MMPTTGASIIGGIVIGVALGAALGLVAARWGRR
jgi:LPXTG-motif cell wall-anchored protein